MHICASNSREQDMLLSRNRHSRFCALDLNHHKHEDKLKNLYPEVIEQNNFDYDTIILINSFTRSSVSAASSARSAAENYTAGGGGFSSGGGGGGSFGGGGSAGGR